MPRRSILNTAERKSLVALPDSQDELIRYYTLSESDLSLIKQHRGQPNRLGFAIQLCYMRYPGVMLAVDEPPDIGLIRLVTSQLNIDPSAWADYAIRTSGGI
jgi:TnpA family transposase